ncbi:MAG: D-tyrosyl-tRNA(Tyr) deacylase [Chitinophagales bacterium]|nr:D-tyrosyl-tRNA(Tyr) deacylase [Chitinophagales bacterium]
MRAIIQRVRQAKVISDGILTGEISQGLMILLGIHSLDTLQDIKWMVHKIVQMRIFSDDNGKMNLSLMDIQGEILIVSQFTLFATTKRGNRPGFTQAAPPAIAIPLYHSFISELKRMGILVQEGIFGADMQIELINDGPVTIILDSKNPE